MVDCRLKRNRGKAACKVKSKTMSRQRKKYKLVCGAMGRESGKMHKRYAKQQDAIRWAKFTGGKAYYLPKTGKPIEIYPEDTRRR